MFSHIKQDKLAIKLLSRKLFSLTLLLTLCLCWGNSVKIYAKAHLAQMLIGHAWNESLHDQEIHKPWGWADTWPVGKLYFPSKGKTLYILSGAQGESLAFGPGLVDGTALPSEKGTTVIGGHRDTHFSFLRNLNIGELFLLQSSKGRWQYYLLDSTQIVDSREGPWEIDPEKEELHFITCYPFNSIISGGPLRYIAIATPIFRIPPLNYTLQKNLKNTQIENLMKSSQVAERLATPPPYW